MPNKSAEPVEQHDRKVRMVRYGKTCRCCKNKVLDDFDYCFRCKGSWEPAGKTSA